MTILYQRHIRHAVVGFFKSHHSDALRVAAQSVDLLDAQSDDLAVDGDDDDVTLIAVDDFTADDFSRFGGNFSGLNAAAAAALDFVSV